MSRLFGDGDGDGDYQPSLRPNLMLTELKIPSGKDPKEFRLSAADSLTASLPLACLSHLHLCQLTLHLTSTSSIPHPFPHLAGGAHFRRIYIKSPEFYPRTALDRFLGVTQKPTMALARGPWPRWNVAPEKHQSPPSTPYHGTGGC